MELDVEAARRAGYSDQEIAQFALSHPDSARARAAGYSDSDILDAVGLAKPDGPNEQLPASLGTGSLTQAPPQHTGLQRAGELAANAVTHGLALGAGAPGDIAAVGRHYVGNPVREFLGLQGLPEGPGSSFLPTSAETTDWADRRFHVGGASAIPGRGEYPIAEKLLTRAGEGAASAIPSTALMGPWSGLGLARNVAAGTAGGLAGELAHEYLPGSERGAGTAGGLLSSILTGGRSGPSLASLAKGLGPAKSFEEAGLNLQESAKNWLATDYPRIYTLLNARVHAATPGSPEYTSALSDFKNFEAIQEMLLKKVTKGPGTHALAEIPAGRVATSILGTAKNDSRELQILREIFPDEVGNLGAAALHEKPELWSGLTPGARSAIAPGKVGKISKSVEAATSSGKPDAEKLAVFGILGSDLVPPLWSLAAPKFMSPELAKIIGGVAPFAARGVSRLAKRVDPRAAVIGANAGDNASADYNPLLIPSP